MPISHAKVSGRSDGGDPSRVQPSDWNADHVGLNGLSSVTIDLTAGQIAGGSTQVLPAQSTGFVNVPVAASFQYKFGTYPHPPSLVALLYDSTVATGPVATHVSAVTSLAVGIAADNGAWQEAQADAQLPLVVQVASGWAGAITAAGQTNGGGKYQVGDTGTITPTISGGTDATYEIDSVLNALPIIAVNQGAQTFTVTGDLSSVAGFTMLVYGSTGNDGFYAVTTAIFGAGVTVITTTDAIPSATADGFGGDENVGSVGTVDTFHMPGAGDRFAVGTFLSTATSGVGAGFDINVTAVSHLSDGTGRLTVLYYVMDLA